jgi:hypothetical protein
MLIVCRRAGLSALEGYYADVNTLAQFGATSGHGGQWADLPSYELGVAISVGRPGPAEFSPSAL